MNALDEINKMDVVTIKPDKGVGVVIMDKADYSSKMNSILSGPQFQLDLGKDQTAKYEFQTKQYVNVS